MLGVLASVRKGFTDYDLIFTNRRILAAKVGSSGVAQVAPGLVGLVGLSLSRSRQDAHRTRYEGLSVDQILASHRKNFEIPYATVERGVFNRGISMVTMPILTIWVSGRKLQFQFIKSIWRKDSAQVAQARDFLSTTLGPRMQFERV